MVQNDTVVQEESIASCSTTLGKGRWHEQYQQNRQAALACWKSRRSNWPGIGCVEERANKRSEIGDKLYPTRGYNKGIANMFKHSVV